ncbi:ATP-dependent helicase HrpB [Permianibacter sp. IMCC34836]|uniref:ATP-dependent helicase HrpB n=1 Tax=Permianibacter fluminis TaxID=2738515 RepID=UPI001556342C|nr:ATP-dependent helicase HrpB [Permianibacter fluminis]NQD36973.1 ATP-dependent helicase HrpB [Permianibacter fluminis]
MSLPIDEVLPQLLDSLSRAPRVVLSAAPGAGKTTRVPLALLDAGWLQGRQILMLEPRRLAAVRAAQYMARQLGESAGERVGYRIRGDSKVGPQTRIVVVTEGILTRMLQEDPELSGVGAVIFDEFHERSLQADLGLALTLEVQDSLRDDLRVLVMSATLDGVAVASLLGSDSAPAPVVASEGRSYPVTTTYLGRNANAPLEPQVVAAIIKALREESGDVLVFLPGQREIRRVQQQLEAQALTDVELHALFGEAAPAQQQAALTPAVAGKRKVILATAIAETSLTIDGVRIVIDSGLARVARFDPVRGMSGLATVNVSQATAEQRRGRAGRQQSGACYRLWSESQHGSLPRFPTPELLSTDLTPFALELAQWGVRDVSTLRLLDAPPAAHLQQARDLLLQLGALDAQAGLTAHGRALARLPVHPRFGHMLVRGKELGLGALACDVAALLEERDILRGQDRSDVDLHTRWLALVHGGAVDRGARDRARQQAKRLRSLLQIRDEAEHDEQIGTLLALAYPERIARQRATPGSANATGTAMRKSGGERSLRYQLASGVGASLPDGSGLSREPFLAVADVDGVGADTKIFLAAALPAEQLENVFGDLIVTRDEVLWDSREHCVVARRRRALGALIFSEQTIESDPVARTAALLDGVRQLGLSVLDWSGAAAQLRARSEWLRQHGYAPSDWPELTEPALLAALERWLAPFVTGLRTRAQLASVDLLAALKSLFSYSQLQELDRLAPTHLTVPTGSRIALDYSGPQPVLAVRLQEVFGERDTPLLAGGKAKVLLHLLAPGRQPIAVTQDLASFWQNAYPDVRKDMRGQYPRHYWPDNPLEAEPTRRSKAADDRAKRNNS